MTNEPDPEGDPPHVVVVCEAPSHEPHVIKVLFTGHPMFRAPGTEMIRTFNDNLVATVTASSIIVAVGGDDPSLRGRWPFECSLCGDRVEVRGERLWPITDTLARHGQTHITLSGLRGTLGL